MNSPLVHRGRGSRVRSGLNEQGPSHRSAQTDSIRAPHRPIFNPTPSIYLRQSFVQESTFPARCRLCETPNHREATSRSKFFDDTTFALTQPRITLARETPRSGRGVREAHPTALCRVGPRFHRRNLHRPDAPWSIQMTCREQPHQIISNLLQEGAFRGID